MDMSNATITRIDRKTGVDVTGQAVLETGDAIALLCLVDEVIETQRRELGANIRDAQAVIYVDRDEMLVADVLATDFTLGGMVATVMDLDGTTAEREILFIKDRQKDEVSHLEIFVKAI
jgi:hypothetical protein